MGKWVTAKQQLVELQKTAFLQEQAAKLQHMQEKHDLFIIQRKEEHELKMKFMIFEHESRMKKNLLE